MNGNTLKKLLISVAVGQFLILVVLLIGFWKINNTIVLYGEWTPDKDIVYQMAKDLSEVHDYIIEGEKPKPKPIAPWPFPRRR